MILFIFRSLSSPQTKPIKSSIYWNITPCSQGKVNRRFIGTYSLHVHLAACFMLVSRLVSFSAIKIGAICSTETSVDFHRTKRRYIPEDRTPNSHRCENLKSKKPTRAAAGADAKMLWILARNRAQAMKSVPFIKTNNVSCFAR
jgi:hypothetical protein